MKFKALNGLSNLVNDPATRNAMGQIEKQSGLIKDDFDEVYNSIIKFSNILLQLQRNSVRIDQGVSSTALTIDLSQANINAISMTGNCTLTLNNPRVGMYLFEISGGASGYTLSFTNSCSLGSNTPGTVTYNIPTGTTTEMLLYAYWNGVNYFIFDYASITYADTKIPLSYIDTDGTLAANSDVKVASQKAIKTYADTKAPKATPTFTGAITVDNFALKGVPVIVQCGADRATSSSSLSDITDLSIGLAANTTYEFSMDLFVFGSSDSNANGYTMNYSASGAAIEGCYEGTGSVDTSYISGRINQFDFAITANSGAHATHFRIYGTIVTGANAGNLVGRFVRIATGTNTVRKYSTLKVWKKI